MSTLVLISSSILVGGAGGPTVDGIDDGRESPIPDEVQGTDKSSGIWEGGRIPSMTTSPDWSACLRHGRVLSKENHIGKKIIMNNVDCRLRMM